MLAVPGWRLAILEPPAILQVTHTSIPSSQRRTGRDSEHHSVADKHREQKHSTHNSCSSFAPAEEIGEYFISVAKKHDLHRHISFGSRAVSALWDERTSKWKITIARKLSDSNDADLQSAVHEADVFINAGGILNNWKWPDIKGLNDFQGQLVHTAAWVSHRYSATITTLYQY